MSAVVGKALCAIKGSPAPLFPRTPISSGENSSQALPLVQDAMTVGRTGFTTGTCAAAAAKAAAMVLCGQRVLGNVDVPLPDGTRVTLPIADLEERAGLPSAAVKKDAGDDPDVTDGCLVVATVTWSASGEFTLRGGEGVGTVTKPGLQVPPGQPAINPVPRRMIRDAVREVTDRSVEVTISIPGGEALAEKTFNPRLGVQGGLSILGTSGIVRPFSSSALRDALKCALSVAVACGVREPAFVPGRIGERAVRRHFQVAPEQVIEVSNEWGFMLDAAAERGFSKLLVLGHPGKLAKLAMGEWDTHSSRSRSAVPEVVRMAEEKWGRPVPDVRTVEGLFAGLTEQERRELGNELAARIREAVLCRVHNKFAVAVVLVNINGALLGQDGDTSAWEDEEPSISIVGCGPGAPEYLTPAAMKAVSRADVLVGAKRLLDLFLSSPAERIEVGTGTRDILDRIEERRGHQQIAVLVTGDPGLFSLAKLVLERFGRDNCSVIPGVSSVQAAFARVGIDWADACIISAHKENPHCDASVWESDKIAVLGGRRGFPRWITEQLGGSNSGDRLIFVCENLTMEDERIREVNLADLATLEVASRGVILVIKRSSLP